MANSKSAAKRARQTQRRSLQNRSVLGNIRTLRKRSVNFAGKSEDAFALVSAIDKAAKRGIIHRNAANRHKARLARLRRTQP